MRIGTGTALIAALLALAPQARAQGLQVDEVNGELEVGFDGYWAQVAANPTLSRTNWRESLLLRLNGFVSDPRLVRFDLVARPLLGQRAWSGFDDSPNGQIQTLNGYGRITLLGGAPISFSAWWSRLSENQDLAFGAHQETDATDWELELGSRWRPLPARLTYSDRSLLQLYRPNGAFGRFTDERRRTLRLSASNSKLRLDVERLDYESGVGDRDFVRNLLDLDHTLRWGKGSRLTSGLVYLTRSGMGQFERVNWRQSVRIRHVRSFSSSLGYQLFDATVLSDFNRGWSASYLGNWSRRSRLKIAFGGEARGRSFRQGTQRYGRARSRLAAGTGLPMGFSLTLAAGAGYEWFKRSVLREDGVGTVVGERHVIDAGGSFTLNEPLAEPTSVVITNEDGTLIFVEGLDYRLVESPPSLEVFALPGGRMTEGTVVLVDYQIRLSAEASENSWTYSYEVKLRKGPFTGYHRRAARKLIDNGTQALSPTFREFDDISVGARLSGGTPIGSLSLAADLAQRARFPSPDSRQLQIRGSWSNLFGPRLKANLTARYTSRTNSRRFKIFEGTGRAEWRATSRLRLHLGLSAYDWTDKAFQAERFVGAGVGAEWQIRRVSARLSYDRNAWTKGFERTEDRLVAQVTRSF